MEFAAGVENDTEVPGSGGTNQAPLWVGMRQPRTQPPDSWGQQNESTQTTPETRSDTSGAPEGDSNGLE